ncbi:MAG: sugar phosphate isomerase/epimerase family protein [Candidatus Hinthialibacter antarcticus]|nr:sugar phosphate isomerase/epimerase family protein [Candidatus Hinthialibacter antarcticus]
MERRSFLTTAATVGAALAASGTSASAAEPTKQAKLKFSCQEWIIPGKTLEDKVAFMKEHDIVGFEPGGKDLDKRVAQYKNAFKGSDIQTSAICAGFDGVLISDKPHVRKRAMESMKSILNAAGELGSTGLIIVPAFNGQTELSEVGGRYILIDLLGELGEHAVKAGSRILLEPLNRGEAWFLRQLSDAAAICEEVNNPGICMMGDFYHMGIEEPCEYSAFMSCRKYLHHVHLASRPNRKQPSYDPNDDFRPGFKALKEIGYQDYCSFECGIEGKGEVELPKAMDMLRKQWAEA